MDRYATLSHIQTLDPERDHQQICHLLAGYEFPWDVTRALEVALLRTFCIPSVSSLLDRTGEFRHHAQKRYDDTGIVVSEVFKHGYDSPRGEAFIQQMNGIHRHYPIANTDYLYVLSTFVYEPIRWCDRFGWRPFCDQERLACYWFWRAIGDRMGILDIPSTYAAFEQFNREFEREHFTYAPSNQRVADATRHMLLSWFPAFTRPMVNWGLPCLLDPPLLDALGWQPTPVAVQRAAAAVLQTRSRLLRRLPPRTTSDFFVDQPQRTYPNSYSLKDIGPDNLRSRL
ncbi:MAG: oxygenase MpaB family protein [Cyanobacteria bacterium J06638_6]